MGEKTESGKLSIFPKILQKEVESTFRLGEPTALQFPQIETLKKSDLYIDGHKNFLNFFQSSTPILLNSVKKIIALTPCSAADVAIHE